jgi:hypothetical protein
MDVNCAKDVTASVGYTSRKFVAGVNNTGGQLAAGIGVSWYW